MEPTYSAGDWLMAKWGGHALKSPGFSLGNIFGDRVDVGDVVVVERPEYPGIFYVKRISEVRHESNQIFLLSDNPEGTDSREWGWLPASSVQAKVVSRIRRAKK